ncbi:MAG: hypothetical protein HOV68_16860 [Streptomycetaceae bacterium]|nr:hypothetical protein [Streptomycetaceae bacterium]
MVLIEELFASTSPRLAAGYRRLVASWTAEHIPTLGELGDAYTAYALADELLPRPLLTLVGYGATGEAIGPDLVDRVGPVCFLAQVVRDFLAIHDDVVDGDLEKFGMPTLPAAFAALAPAGPPEQRAKHGDDVAVYFGDLLLGLVGDLVDAARVPAAVRYEVALLVSQALRRNQRGQLVELGLQHRDPATLDVGEVLAVYADKAAEYCYVLPYEIGAVLRGAPLEERAAARAVLEAIGTASQIVDDLLGELPELTGRQKDTPGELAHMRRTVLAVEAARALPPGHPMAAVLAGQTATADEAQALREVFASTGAVRRAAAHAERLTADAEQRIPGTGFAPWAQQYLHDLITVRIRENLGLIG